MGAEPRMTLETLRVLKALLAEPLGEHYGLELAKRPDCSPERSFRSWPAWNGPAGSPASGSRSTRPPRDGGRAATTTCPPTDNTSTPRRVPDWRAVPAPAAVAAGKRPAGQMPQTSPHPGRGQALHATAESAPAVLYGRTPGGASTATCTRPLSCSWATTVHPPRGHALRNPWNAQETFGSQRRFGKIDASAICCVDWRR
jgi:hypothetical protein